MINTVPYHRHEQLVFLFGLPLSVYAVGLVLVALGVYWWSSRRTQRAILANTEAILALMRASEHFLDEASLAREMVELNIAAGVAREELAAA